VPAQFAGVAPENIGKGIKKKQETREKFQEDEGTPAVIINLMARTQKNTHLKAEKRKKNK
jgi:hypothetical protein